MKAKAHTDDFKVSATFTLHNKPVNALWQWSQVPQVEVTAHAMLPSTSVIKFTLGTCCFQCHSPFPPCRTPHSIRMAVCLAPQRIGCRPLEGEFGAKTCAINAPCFQP